MSNDLAEALFADNATPPLAKILPRMKHEIGLLYSSKSFTVRERYCRQLATLETSKQLYESIFELSQEP